MADTASDNQPLFKDLSADNIDELETTEVESLCMSCHEQVTSSNWQCKFLQETLKNKLIYMYKVYGYFLVFVPKK